jgi:ABC-2 type transport system permease protein
MKIFLSFVRKEFIHILRDMRTMLIVMFMPVILMLLFGFAITTEIKNIDVMTVVDKYSPDVRSELTALENNPYITYKGTIRESDVDAMLRSGKCAAVVMFACDGRRNIVLDASNPSISASVGSYLTQILQGVEAQEAMKNTRSGMTPQTATLPVTTYMRHNPQLKSSYNFVPGVMGLILILICSIMTCVSVVREKEMGTLEVLLVSPVKPIYVVLPKMIPYFVISLINIITILLISHFVLSMPVYGNLPTLLALCILYIVLSLALGLFISTLVKSQMVALIICAMVMMVPMMMLSGMLYPIENLPPGLKEVSYFVPARWFIEAIRKVMVEGLGMGAIWEEMLILTAMTVFLFGVSLRKFNDRLEKKPKAKKQINSKQ